MIYSQVIIHWSYSLTFAVLNTSERQVFLMNYPFFLHFFSMSNSNHHGFTEKCGSLPAGSQTSENSKKKSSHDWPAVASCQLSPEQNKALDSFLQRAAVDAGDE